MRRFFFDRSPSPNIKAAEAAPTVSDLEDEEVHKLAYRDAEACEAPGVNRTFILQRDPKNAGPVRFAVFGCHGDGKQGAHDVGHGIDHYCKFNNQSLDFVILTGDNCYPEGMDKVTDRRMPPSFNHPFPDQSENLQVPYMALSGNHEQNQQSDAEKTLNRVTKPRLAKANTGIPRLLNMMGYTFVSYENNRYQHRQLTLGYYNKMTDKDKAAGGRHIDLANLKKNKIFFNMPRRYYSLLVEDKGALLDAEFLLLDSNNFAVECLAYFRSGNSLSAVNNQVAWTLTRLRNAFLAKRKVVVFQHHPLYVLGKPRHDIDHYMSQDDADELILQLQKIMPELKEVEIKSQNALLYFCMLALGIAFDRNSKSELIIDLVVTAHDHNFYYLNNKGKAPQQLPIPCQITAGTGGGKLQDQFFFEPRDSIGAFLKKTGFVIMSYTNMANEFEFGFYTADNKYILYFDTNSCTPIQSSESVYDNNALNEINLIGQFFYVITKSIREYLSFISERQIQSNYKFLSTNSSHGSDGVIRANELLAYMNDARPKINYPKVVSEVLDYFARNPVVAFFVNDHDHSLITLINNEMLLAYGQTLEEHSQKPELMKNGYKGKVGIREEQERPRTGLN